MKDFLSICDLAPHEVSSMVKEAARIKNGPTPRLLKGKVIAILFEKPSLRTRVSFEVGIRQMGGECVYLGKEDIGLGVREPESDVARVLERWVDGIVARVNSHDSLDLLAQNASVPVINALSDVEHPCQAVADLLTLYQHHKERLDGLRVAFVGDGNNVASSLALACSSVGADFTLASPGDYRIPADIWDEAVRRASLSGAHCSWVEEPAEAVRDADAVYTDVWVSMGQAEETERRLKAFKGYQVDEALLGAAKPDALFMHDMPVHRGEEVSPGMVAHPRSVVFDQAENRLHAQKAILARLFSP